jgi:hypothetical protein
MSVVDSTPATTLLDDTLDENVPTSHTSSSVQPKGAGSPADLAKLFNAKGKGASKRMLKTYNLSAEGVASLASSSPVLILEPSNATFEKKRLELFEPVKVGRQTTPKQPPKEDNGVFDSKVLSRQHAEVWTENGKVGARALLTWTKLVQLMVFA